jgi:cation diffusion facilitator family transporter
MARGSTGVVVKALAANLGIACAKFVVAAISGSAAMLAEAVHSLADTGNQVLLLVGMRQARRGEDPRHEFGHGPEGYFWEFIVAVSLFTIGATFSIYEGVAKITHRGAEAELGNALPAYVVLGVSILLELYSLQGAVSEFKHLRGNKTVSDALDQLRDAAVLVVLFEDLAALTGLVVALIGIGLSHLLHDVLWDGVASIVVGAVLATVAYLIASKTKHLLIGESVPLPVRRRIVELTSSAPGVRRMIHLRTMHLGPDDVVCAMKVAFDDNLPSAEAAGLIDGIEARLRAELPQLRRIYVEVGTVVPRPKAQSVSQSAKALPTV